MFTILLAFVTFSVTPAFANNDYGTPTKLKTTAVASTPAPDNAVEANKGVLLFFINPQGHPCQIQARILSENIAEFEKYVQIQAISTTISSHRQYFYQFGIRQLPSLVLLDSAGGIVQRFSPGIHEKESLLSTIKQLKKK